MKGTGGIARRAGGTEAVVPQALSDAVAQGWAVDVAEGSAVAVAQGAADAGRPAAARVAAIREAVTALDVARLSERERVDLIAELERVKGAVCAVQARATHALRESRERSAPQDAVRSVGSEVALARRESPALGDRFVGLARALVTELPETMTALTAGVIGERHAVEVAQQSATLSAEDRSELDRRLAPVLGRLGVQGLGRAARRVAAELDAAAVVRRMEQAVRSRRVSVRPAPDGMAYLTVLAPMPEIVGAYAALRSRAAAVAGGQCPDEAPGGRAVGPVMADTATRLLSGRAPGQAQPVEVHLVMTDRSLLGVGDPARSVAEPARVPGHGPLAAATARAWLRSAEDGSVWLRRLYTCPDGRDLVAMDSRRRVFTGLLRRMLVLRDDVCTTPWCESPIVHADHATPVREGGVTDFRTGNGRCARCNQVKEAPGWTVAVTRSGLPRVPGHSNGPHELRVTTPTGRTYRSQAPPITGWGWQPAAREAPLGEHIRRRPLSAGRRPRRRPRLTSPLERHLVDVLAAA
jgi:Domain of unknown function (DUF222)